MSDSRSQPWTLLAQLSGAHDQLMAEMDKLELVTGGLLPALGDITTARWRISQASLRRRSLASRVFDYLGERLDGEELAALQSFQSADREMMRRSAQHVSRWTGGTISEDWAGYCRASRDIRAHMRRQIELEKRNLYPLLERLAAQSI